MTEHVEAGASVGNHERVRGSGFIARETVRCARGEAVRHVGNDLMTVEADSSRGQLWDEYVAEPIHRVGNYAVSLSPSGFISWATRR